MDVDGRNPDLSVRVKHMKFTRAIVALVILSCSTLLAGPPYPARLSSAHDIKRAKRTADDIDIWKLPLKDFPLLAKFTKVESISFNCREGTFATDEKLKALAGLGLTNLAVITLLNCRLITDAGIEALSHINALTGLELEGTAITDKACQIIASQMGLTNINIANCPGVTLRGLKLLAASEKLNEISFSADKLTQDEVLSLIGSFKNVVWCQIVDPQLKLDEKLLKAKGGARNMLIVYSQTGALQDSYGKPD